MTDTPTATEALERAGEEHAATIEAVANEQLELAKERHRVAMQLAADIRKASYRHAQEIRSEVLGDGPGFDAVEGGPVFDAVEKELTGMTKQ